MFISLPSPELPSDVSAPTAPNITLAKDRFMPLHIMFVNIRPDAPTRDPLIIRAWLSIRNPVAAAAIPE